MASPPETGWLAGTAPVVRTDRRAEKCKEHVAPRLIGWAAGRENARRVVFIEPLWLRGPARSAWMPLNRMNRQRRSDANRNGDHEQPTPWRRGAGSGTFRIPSLFSGLRRFVAYASCGGVVPAGGHVTTSRTYHFHKSMNFWKFSSSKVAYSSRFVLIL